MVTLKRGTGEQNANQVSGLLIHVNEHVHLTSCFDFDLSSEQDSVN